MHNVSPAVYLIAKTNVLDGGARAWLDGLGAEEYKLEQDRTDGEQLVMLAGTIFGDFKIVGDYWTAKYPKV